MISELKNWFTGIWNDSEPIRSEEFKQCNLAWNNRKNRDWDPGGNPNEDDNTLILRRNKFTSCSWSKYENSLKTRAHQMQPKMKKSGGPNNDLGDDDIWTSLLKEAKKVLKNWEKDKRWDENRGKVLAGTEDPYKPFGDMSSAGAFCGVMVYSKDPEKRDRILKTLSRFKDLDVSNLSAKEQAEKVCSYLEEIKGEERVGIASATRLLTLTRPELAFSYNRSSSKNLHLIGGIISDGITVENYKNLLIQFYSTEWYRSPKPKEEFLIWQCRMALIDLLVYEHNSGSNK